MYTCIYVYMHIVINLEVHCDTSQNDKIFKSLSILK